MSRQNISVVLCTYNGEKYINHQLDSIIKQTKKDDEIIIIDDNSVDESYEILKKYSKLHTSIKLYQNSENIGYLRNFMKALSLATNDIVFLSDQDDVWVDNKVDRVLGKFKSESNINVIFTDAYLINNDVVELRSSLWETLGYKHTNENELFIQLLKRNVATGATMAFRKEFMIKTLPIPISWVHDGWFTIVAALNDSAFPMEDRLIQYRQHDNNVIGAKKQRLSTRINKHLKNPELINKSIDEKLDRFENLMKYINSNNILISDKKMKALEECIIFWRARKNIKSQGNTKSIYTILCNLLHGGYNKYSNGLSSIIQDLYRLKK